jgi:hypothetical protein
MHAVDLEVARGVDRDVQRLAVLVVVEDLDVGSNSDAVIGLNANRKHFFSLGRVHYRRGNICEKEKPG